MSVLIADQTLVVRKQVLERMYPGGIAGFRNVVFVHQLCGVFNEDIPWLEWRRKSDVLNSTHQAS